MSHSLSFCLYRNDDLVLLIPHHQFHYASMTLSLNLLFSTHFLSMNCELIALFCLGHKIVIIGVFMIIIVIISAFFFWRMHDLSFFVQDANRNFINQDGDLVLLNHHYQLSYTLTRLSTNLHFL